MPGFSAEHWTIGFAVVCKQILEFFIAALSEKKRNSAGPKNGHLRFVSRDK